MMQPAEQNYKIYDKELLTIVEALTKWRQYLLDTMEPFEVWTDHEKLQDYDFTLKYILGKTNTKADILSRKEQVNTKEDNKDVQLLKEELWQQRTIAEIIMIKRKTIVEEGNILKEIKRNTTREKEVVQALKKEDSLIWEEDRVVYMEGRVYVPNNRKIQKEILKENHDSVNVGHPG